MGVLSLSVQTQVHPDRPPQRAFSDTSMRSPSNEPAYPYPAYRLEERRHIRKFE